MMLKIGQSKQKYNSKSQFILPTKNSDNIKIIENYDTLLELEKITPYFGVVHPYEEPDDKYDHFLNIFDEKISILDVGCIKLKNPPNKSMFNYLNVNKQLFFNFNESWLYIYKLRITHEQKKRLKDKK